jgi:acyl-CoA reductase-like NAD-dependent aldehyde dehydrogenase
MLVMKEESFGPIIGIMKVNSDEEAIRLMADSEYGLTASVYSKDRQRAENILHKINAGSGYWNCCDAFCCPALEWPETFGIRQRIVACGLHSCKTQGLAFTQLKYDVYIVITRQI